MNIVIYGAQGVALGAYNAIKEVSPDKKVLCFLVTKMENNASILGGIPVRELEEFSNTLNQEEKDAIQILIATPESFMADIEKNIKAAGFDNYQKLDSMTWAGMQEKAFIKNRKFIPVVDYVASGEAPEIQVYMVKSCKDKQLSKSEVLPKYLIPIQAGAANTTERVANILDCDGDNISIKNSNYSELTVLYWIWKNKILSDLSMANHYYGLAHYRRFLLLSEDDLKRLRRNDIDVVLPYPMPYEPNIEVHHERYLSSEEWNAVITALKELEPEYAKVFPEILAQGYLYNYNIIIAKGNVLADYCNWLFPLLFRIEELNISSMPMQPNRFIGYASETLETLYFMYNKYKLKIAHTGCKFIL